MCKQMIIHHQFNEMEYSVVFFFITFKLLTRICLNLGS